MSRRPIGRRVITVAAAVLVVAGVTGSAVVAGHAVWAGAPVALGEALAETPAIKLAEIPASDRLPARGVYAQVTAGLFCVSDAPLTTPTMGGGGCNPDDDPLGGRRLSASLSFDGGPAFESVRDARISGLAADAVARLQVVMSDGSSRTVRLVSTRLGSGDFQAFGYRFRKSDLKKGIGPVAIVAFDANGDEIDRQTTGIG